MKVKGCIRRTVAGLMIGLTLFGVYSATYMQARECQASNPYVLQALFDAITISMGYTTNSLQGNEQLCNAFCSWLDDMKNGKEEAKTQKEKEFCEKYGEACFEQVELLKATPFTQPILVSRFMTGAFYEALKFFMENKAKKHVSRNNTISSNGTVSSPKPFFYDKQIKNDLNRIFADENLPGYGSISYVTGFFDRTSEYGSFLYAFKSSDELSLFLYSDVTSNYKNNYGFYPDGNFFICKSIIDEIFITSDSSAFLTSDANLKQFVYGIEFKRTALTSPWSYYNTAYTKNLGSIMEEPNLLIDDCFLPIFDSKENLSAFVDSHKQFENINGLYGDPSLAFDYPEDYTISPGDTTLQETISQAIADALENSDTGSLTADEVNQIVADNVNDYSDQLGDISDNTGQIADEQQTTNNWLSKTYNLVKDWFSDYSAMMNRTLAGSILKDILAKITDLPLALGDVFMRVLSTTAVAVFPKDWAWEYSDTRPLQGLLEGINTSVRELCVADTATIDLAIENQYNRFNNKIPIGGFQNVVNQFNFSDNYDYPIIKIQTPDIIKQFTHKDYIILFDGKDYASYFKFFRGLLTAMLWLAYGYAVLCKFKVRFVLS